MVTIPLIVCSTFITTTSTIFNPGTVHDTDFLKHKLTPMQHLDYMNNNKLQYPHYMPEHHNTMNMTPLENSLLYDRDNYFDFSQPQHFLQSTITMENQQRSFSERILHDVVGLLHILSPSGKILYCSESCIKLIGYHPQELIGNSLTDYLHSDDLHMLTRNLQMSFNTLNTIKIYYRIRRKDNTYLLLESIGQPQQDTPDQPPQLFFAIAQPCLSKNNQSLDMFLEIRMENEWLRKQLHDMMLSQGGSPISASADIYQYQQHLHQLQQNTDHFITNSSGNYNQHHHQLNNSQNLNFQHANNENELNVQYYPPQRFPTTATSNNTAARLFDTNNNDLLLGPSAQYYMSSNDSPEFKSRRPSSCSSTMFQTNNNNHNSTSTTADDNTNNHWNTNYSNNHNSSSVTSSVEVNERMLQYQQEEHINTTSAESLSATASNAGGGLASTSAYLSSNNSTTTVNTDIVKKEKWKRRKKSRGAEDYLCADCGTTASPEWRKGPQGPKTLCNACGLRWAKKNKKI